MKRLNWTGEQVFAFLREEFPQAFRHGRDYAITHLQPGAISLRHHCGEDALRPGGTVSGPAMMELVDFTVYALLLAHHRASARLAVTTNLAISFLRKPAPGPMVCHCTLIKHGRTLSVADCRIVPEDDENIILAHAEATYFMGGAVDHPD